MKIVIIGTGAMGSLFACQLSRLADVVMLGTWSEQLAMVDSNGLLLQHPNGKKTRHFISATSQPETVGESDIVLVLVKAWQTSRAAHQANNILSRNGVAITLQNGLDNLQQIAAVIGEKRAVQGITSEGAMMIGPGIVRHAGSGITHIAVNKNSRDLIADLAALLKSAGFETELVESAESLIWGKLAVNAGINPLSALLQVPNGILAVNASTRDIMCHAADETASVARAQSISLPYESAPDRVLEVAKATAENRSSMAQDIARGMPSEIDFISGAIVRIGQQHRVDTPVNRALLTLIKSQITTGEWQSKIEEIPEPWQSKFKAILSVSSQK